MLETAIDFDSVCIDTSFLTKNNIDITEYSLSPYSIYLAEPRHGVKELFSAIGLFTGITVLSSRPDGHRELIKSWFAMNNLENFVSNIICSPEIISSSIFRERDLAFLVSGNPRLFTIFDEYVKTIPWISHHWKDIIEKVLALFASEKKISFNGDPTLILTEAKQITDIGDSPVFLLKFANATCLKLRVCSDESMKRRLVRFHEITTVNNYQHLPRLVASNGVVVVSTFIDGTPISSIELKDRVNLIYTIGKALAELHAIKADSKDFGFKMGFENESGSLLILSADEYNTVVKKDGGVAFIDLGSCMFGSRWIDLSWSYDFLCKTQEEREAFWSGYRSTYHGAPPTDIEMNQAELARKIWLTDQLKRSWFIHSYNPGKMDEITRTLRYLWRKHL